MAINHTTTGLIPAMRSNQPEKAQRLIPQDPLWGILFLRLEGTHLRTQGGVFDGGHYSLLCVKVGEAVQCDEGPQMSV